MEVSKFIAYVTAKITGDKQAALALKNEKIAKASINGQISAIDAAIVHAEIEVEQAKENYANVVTSTTSEGEVRTISDSTNYVRSIVEAKEELDDAEEALQNLIDDRTFYQSLLQEYFA